MSIENAKDFFQQGVFRQPLRNHGVQQTRLHSRRHVIASRGRSVGELEEKGIKGVSHNSQ